MQRPFQSWLTTTISSKKHVRYGGQKIYFQNKTGNELTNITVTFYEKVNGEYKVVGKEQTIPSVPAGKVSDAITIPGEPCAYVRFTDENGFIGKPYYNFYKDDVASNEVGTFQYKRRNKLLLYLQWVRLTSSGVRHNATTHLL